MAYSTGTPSPTSEVILSMVDESVGPPGEVLNLSGRTSIKAVIKDFDIILLG